MTTNGFKHAATEDVEEWVFQNKAVHVDCRVKGHNWSYPHAVENEDGTFSQTEKCRRCQTKRTELVDADGYTLNVKCTDYPEGYLLPRGTGRMDRDGRAILRKHRIQNNIAKRVRR
jgi:hypothetical protein